MSRSALLREELKRAKQQTSNAPIQPTPPVMPIPYYTQMQQMQQMQMAGYMQQMVANPMYGVVPVVPAPGYDMSLQYAASVVPVPLTGDDEDYEPAVTRKVLPIYGNQTTFNLNSLLHSNLLNSDYFRALYQLKTYHEVLQEITNTVTHVEPWQTGTSRIPSTAFCLLLKLMVMSITQKQMQGILNYKGCIYVRALGFLHLRYTCPPTELWKWYEPYLEDETEIHPSSDQSITMKIGEYCHKLLTDMNYFGTTLPRIPVPVERKIRVMLLLQEEKVKRREKNMKYYQEGYFSVGSKIKAIYSDDENEPAWYEAVIESIEEESEEKSQKPQFWVKFSEYGNEELVDLGNMDLIEKPTSASTRHTSRSRSTSRQRETKRRERSRSRDGRRERSRSRDRSRRDHSRERDRHDRKRDDSRDRREDERDKSDNKESDLMAKVLQSSREASAAVGKNYGQRPASYKGSLSLKMDRFTARRKSPSRSPDRRGGSGSGSSNSSSGYRRSRDDSRDRDRHNDPNSRRGAETNNSSYTNTSMSHSMMQRQQEKMNKLKERYGDASAK